MPQSQELQELIAAIPQDFADPAADYHKVREAFAPFHGHPVSAALRIEDKDYRDVRCGHYSLADNDSPFLAFHCHGGAFVSTPLDEYHFYAELIARETGCNVVMPDYRLAPEHRFPAAHDDCFNAYAGLLESGADAGKIVVLGESCGGSLALALLQRARDEALPLPAAFISVTGWFDLSVAGPPAPGSDPFLDAQWVRNRAIDYAGREADLRNPQLSPCFGEMRGLPPMYLQIGEHDTVREGAITLATEALRAGVAVNMEAWPGAIHGWHGLTNANVPEAKSAWRAIRAYIATL